MLTDARSWRGLVVAGLLGALALVARAGSSVAPRAAVTAFLGLSVLIAVHVFTEGLADLAWRGAGDGEAPARPGAHRKPAEASAPEGAAEPLCPVCSTAVGPVGTACPRCGARHHVDCYALLCGCSALRCRDGTARPPHSAGAATRTSPVQ